MITMYKLTKRVYYDDPTWDRNSSDCYGYYLAKELAEVARKKWCHGGVTYSWRFGSGRRAGTVSWDIDPVQVYEKEEEI